MEQNPDQYPAEPSYIIPELRHLAVAVATLNVDPENARLHPPDNVAVVRGSLVRFGQYLPLIVQRNGMIIRVGNNRFSIARELGWTHVAVIVTDHPDEVARTLAITDNRSGELAKWDPTALRALISNIRDFSPTLLDVTGFTATQREQLLILPKSPEIPNANKVIDERALAKTEHQCPKCEFKW